MRKAGLICRWINESKEVYEVLISNLEATKSKLLDAVKITTNATFDNENNSEGADNGTVGSKVNDTPQEPGYWDGEDYTSSISATESSSHTETSSSSNGVSNTTTLNDINTPMARLKEIENNLRSLYGKWANEFSRFIIYSAI